jgi:hypothetical protein
MEVEATAEEKQSKLGFLHLLANLLFILEALLRSLYSSNYFHSTCAEFQTQLAKESTTN